MGCTDRWPLFLGSEPQGVNTTGTPLPNSNSNYLRWQPSWALQQNCTQALLLSSGRFQEIPWILGYPGLLRAHQRGWGTRGIASHQDQFPPMARRALPSGLGRAESCGSPCHSAGQARPGPATLTCISSHSDWHCLAFSSSISSSRRAMSLDTWLSYASRTWPMVWPRSSSQATKSCSCCFRN